MITSFPTILQTLVGIVVALLATKCLIILLKSHRLFFSRILFDGSQIEIGNEITGINEASKTPFLKSFTYRIGLSILFVSTLMSILSVLVWLNGYFFKEVDLLGIMFGRMLNNSQLHIGRDELCSGLSSLRIIIALFFIIEPAIEIYWLKCQRHKLKPKGRVMTANEAFHYSKEMGRRFYSRPFALMTLERRYARRLMFFLGFSMMFSSLVIWIVEVLGY